MDTTVTEDLITVGRLHIWYPVSEFKDALAFGRLPNVSKIVEWLVVVIDIFK